MSLPRLLESALRSFVTDAAALLAARVDAGEEVPFEVAPQGGRRGAAALYCYRPLTGDFIAQRADALGALPSHAEALGLLADGIQSLDRYLLAHGRREAPREDRRRAGIALLCLLEDVFDGQSDFTVRDERLRGAIQRLWDCAVEGRAQTTVIGVLRGLVLSSPEVRLAGGLTLARPDELRPDDVPPTLHGLGGEATLCVLELADDDGWTPERGGELLRELLRALRLFGDGRLALEPLGWTRIDAEGPWLPLALGAGGRSRGLLVLAPEQEDELRAFCSLVSRRSPSEGRVAWALGRFDAGCDRASDHEALSDFLLALRALLHGDTPGELAARLAAICAPPERRQALAQRVLAALELERAIVAGRAETRGDDALIAAIAGHLRALLRDVACGHLPEDLVGVAEGLLLEDRQPLESGPPESGPPEPTVERVQPTGRFTRDGLMALAMAQTGDEPTVTVRARPE